MDSSATNILSNTAGDHTSAIILYSLTTDTSLCAVDRYVSIIPHILDCVLDNANFRDYRMVYTI